MSLKGALNDPHTWKEFQDRVHKEEAVWLKMLKNSSEPHLVFRAQGAVEALRKVLQFREQMNAGK